MKKSTKKPIRYAVVGLGHITQNAVLPAFSNAKRNSQLSALISDDPKKLRTLARQYGIASICGYRDYDAFLRSGNLDAVYLALPNSLHCDYAVRAAKAGIHVLSEKPLAVTEAECQEIIQACAENGVKLMTAYRLHFERANLEAVKILSSGKIGSPRIFQSLFTMQVKAGNIRLNKDLGGGTLYDIGIYCINAARYLFRDEPVEVFAYSARGNDSRFKEVDEMTSVVMRFPQDRLAAFTTSFGAADAATYTVVGTRGILSLNRAYEYSNSIDLELIANGRKQKRKYALRDQFAPELLYFSDCIRLDKEPEPSGIEGLLDVHIIRCLYESARTGLPVPLKQLSPGRRPDLRQEIHRPPAAPPQLVHAEAPSRD